MGIRPRDTGHYVGSISVHDNRFSTADGIRVGMRLGDLPNMAWPRVDYGEGSVVLVLKDRGITLGLEAPPGVDLNRGDLAPSDARVRTIGVWGSGR